MTEQNSLEEQRLFVLRRYDEEISRYFSSAASNKRNYQQYRFLPVFLAAMISVFSTLSLLESIEKGGSLI